MQSHNEALETSREPALSDLEIKPEVVITEQRKLQLKESELLNRFQKLVRHAPVAMCIFRGPKYIVELANEQMFRLWGRTEELVIGKPVFEAMPDLGGQGFEELLRTVLTTGERYVAAEAPLSLLRGGKSEAVFVRFVYEPLYEDDGTISGVMAVADEITDLVLARKSVEESEYRYHELIHSSPSLIAILEGPNYKIKIANQAIIDIWGKGQEVMGKLYLETLPELVEQGVDAMLRGVYETGVPFHGNEMPINILRHGKPELKYYTFVFQPQRKADGEIEGVAIIGSEVSPQALLNLKLKQSEQEFRLIADSLPAKITNADTDGNVYYFNKAWVDYTGLSYAELQNGGWAKAMHPDALEEVTKRWLNAVASGTDFEMDFLLKDKAGTYKWHVSRAVPIKDEAGKVIKWVGATTEIHTQTEQKAALEKAVVERTAELREAADAMLFKNEQLKNMNVELESFTYVSSHDLQEPLRKIQTFTNLIRSDEHSVLSDKGNEAFNRIERAASRMRLLIEHLLAYSQATKNEHAFEKTDLNKIVAEVLDDLSERILERGATIDVRDLCDLCINPFQFRQLIQNLLTNALKFSRPDVPPRITIYCHVANGDELMAQNLAIPANRLSPDKSYCHIAFSDNGIGFEPQYNEKMFQVFQRLNTREQFEGTGIGLAIVRRIVEQHDGLVTASGELGVGATFNIYVPAG